MDPETTINMNANSNSSNETIRDSVRAGYAQIAQQGSERQTGQGCCGSGSELNPETLAQHLGYGEDELQALPEGANMGLSCGNPAALAALKPGDIVLDLGAGGGFDVFIAGRKVGPTGRAIGVDMTAEMLSRARANIASYRESTGWDNVEFRLGEIEHLPVADNSVDGIISNCVINLSPDKAQVWREIARVLKPGGRVAVSDIALLQPLPESVREMIEALVGCVAGAVLVRDTERFARAAGLANVEVNMRPDYLTAMENAQDPLYRNIMDHLPEGVRPADYITSAEITARKPGRAGGCSGC